MSKKKLIHPYNHKNRFFNKQDPIFSSWFVNKLINNLPIKDRARNRRAVYLALGKIKRLLKVNPLFVLVLLIQYLRPLVWVRVRKFGKKEYRIPYRLSPMKQYKKSLKWLTASILSRTEKTLEDRIANEIIDLIEKKSKIFSWRKSLVADVVKNRHNASYKW